MATGVICEYNPFHMGHEYHIKRTKELTGGEPVVCVMSGNFVQRGEAAVLPKHVRAKAALMCGADLVVELPVPWALSSAEVFAKGGTAIVRALGCDAISFGSESGDTASLVRLAEAMKSGDSDSFIKDAVRGGMSYPEARQKAARELIGEKAELLLNPNDLLGTEYIAALNGLGGGVLPLAIKRVGASHDAESGASASAIRATLKSGGGFDGMVPEAAKSIFETAISDGLGPVTMEALEIAVLSRLRALSDEAWRSLPGAGEGFGIRLRNAAQSAASLDALYEAAKTRRYPLSRIRRSILWAAIGIKDGDADGIPPYIRVLGANAEGRRILRGSSGELPIITKPAAVRNIGGEAERIFRIEAAATDLYSLGFPDCSRRLGGLEWTLSPIMP